MGFSDMFSGPFVAPVQVGATVLLEKLIRFFFFKKKREFYDFDLKAFAMKSQKIFYLSDFTL